MADLSPDAPPDGWPSVTIVVAGRNEAAGIEPALKSLLAIDYPSLTIRAVDDRSTDATGSIMDRLASADPRLEVRHVAVLPPGWLGKNHAMHQAIQSLKTDYVLFTDADVVFSRDALKKAVGYFARKRLDMMPVFPEMTKSGPFETAIVTVFAIMLSLRYQNWMIEHPKLRVYLGIGAFNLVRRQVLERIDGFSHLKLSVDDDVRLGEAAKVHGFKLKVLYGVGEVRVKWQDSFWGYVKGLEKNGFASTGFRVYEAAWTILSSAIVLVSPFVGVLAGDGATRVLSLFTLALLALCLQAGRRSTGAGAHYLPLIPFVGLAFSYSLLNSMITTLRQGGIQWRGHLYPLAELKAHIHERKRWLDAAWKSTRANHRLEP